jgi:hypothetical protein
MESAIVGWRLDLIGHQLAEIIGVDYEGDFDEEGHTSKYLFALSDWFRNSDFGSVRLWLGFDPGWEDRGKNIVGCAMDFDRPNDWVWNISEGMKKFEQHCLDKGVEFEYPPEFYDFCEDYGFIEAEEYFTRGSTD